MERSGFDRLFLREQSWGNDLDCELLCKVFTCLPDWK